MLLMLFYTSLNCVLVAINCSTVLIICRFNEEMIETLFGCNAVDKKSTDGKKEPAKEATQLVRILDAKKAQNLSISLKALSVSAADVRTAVTEGKIDISFHPQSSPAQAR
jgi:hypothetical protein